MNLLHLRQPLLVLGAKPLDLLHQPLDLLHLRPMLVPPAGQAGVRGRGIPRQRLVEAGVLDLLVRPQLGSELLPELSALLRRGVQHLREGRLGRLVLVLEKLNRIHHVLSSFRPWTGQVTTLRSPSKASAVPRARISSLVARNS